MKVLGTVLVFLLFFSVEAYSQAGSYLFFVDSSPLPNVLYRVTTSGTNKTLVFTSPDSRPWINAIAVDASQNKLYLYVDDDFYSSGKIYTCNLDGGGISEFLDGDATSMAAANGYIYYAPYHTGELRRIKSDKSENIVLYTPAAGVVRDVALDIPNSLLYFYEENNPYTIYKCNLTGGSRTAVHDNGGWSLNSLTAGNGNFFFTTANTPFTFSRKTSAGTGLTTIYTPMNGSVVSDAVYDPVNFNLYFGYLTTIYKGNSTGSSYSSFIDVGSGIYAGTLAIAPNVVLPVELILFTGTTADNIVTLKWTTATEIKNYGFEIERNQNPSGDKWEKVGFVSGNGNSNSPKKYSYVDKPGKGRQLQYRLKQIDTDGSYKYSPVVNLALNPEQFALTQNYPNPFNPSTKISYSVPSASRVLIKVYDVLGKEVTTLLDKETETGSYSLEFNAEDLTGGVYFYKMTSGAYSETRKMIVMK